MKKKYLRQEWLKYKRNKTATVYTYSTYIERICVLKYSITIIISRTELLSIAA